MSTQRTAERKAGKRQRVPFGGLQQKLQLSKEDRKALDEAGFVPRVINDVDGRIEAAQAGGYEFVTPEEAPSWGGSGVHEGNSDLNGKCSKVVSRGGEKVIRGYLMKIKKEFYDEDQEAKEQRNRAIDDAMRAGNPGGSSVENSYIPEGGIKL